MIEIQYVREAKRIITNYNRIVSQLSLFEKTLNTNKDILLKLKKDIDKLSESNNTELAKKQELAEIMLSYDKEIGKLQSVMLPYISDLEKIKKNSTTLYALLKEKYPGMSDKQLQDSIFQQMEKDA